MHYITFRMFKEYIEHVKTLDLSMDIFYTVDTLLSDDVAHVYAISHVLNDMELDNVLRKYNVVFGSVLEHLNESTFLLHNSIHYPAVTEAYKAYKRDRTLTELIG